MKVNHVTIDGLRINYRKTGKGTPVLFVHGIGGMRGWEFEPSMRHLSGNYELVAIDLPSMSFAQPMTNSSIENYTELIDKFIQKLNWQKFFFVGSSYGGLIALNFAHINPRKVEKLVLHAPPWNAKFIGISVSKLLLKSDFLFNISKTKFGWVLMRGLAAVCCRYLPFRDLSKLSSKIRNKLASGMLASDVTLLEVAREVFFLDMQKIVKAVKIPTLVLEGDKSRLISPKSSQKLAEIMPNAKLVMIKDCAHNLPSEKPREFAQAIKEFVQ